MDPNSTTLREAATYLRTAPGIAPTPLTSPAALAALAAWLDSEADLLDGLGPAVELISTSLRLSAGQDDLVDLDGSEPSTDTAATHTSPALTLAREILSARDSSEPWTQVWGIRYAGHVHTRPYDGAPAYTEATARADKAQRIDSPEVVTRLVPPWTSA